MNLRGEAPSDCNRTGQGQNSEMLASLGEHLHTLIKMIFMSNLWWLMSASEGIAYWLLKPDRVRTGTTSFAKKSSFF